MTIDKAIQKLTVLLVEEHYYPTGHYQGAIRLGIKALKWRRLMELDYGSWCGPLMPGETKK